MPTNSLDQFVALSKCLSALSEDGQHRTLVNRVIKTMHAVLDTFDLEHGVENSIFSTTRRLEEVEEVLDDKFGKGAPGADVVSRVKDLCHDLKIAREVAEGASQELRHKAVNADLSGADFRQANLSGVDLRRAKLSGANLEGAKYNNATKFPTDFDPEANGMVLTR